MKATDKNISQWQFQPGVHFQDGCLRYFEFRKIDANYQPVTIIHTIYWEDYAKIVVTQFGANVSNKQFLTEQKAAQTMKMASTSILNFLKLM